MFDEYAKKLETIHANVPKIFKFVATKGAIFAVNTAKKITDKEGLIDTGNYKRNWFADVIEPEKNIYGVQLANNTEYATHLEYGYTLTKDRFIPFDKMEGTPKTKSLIAKLKAKYPNAKGFIRKAGKYKGKFVGQQTLDETNYYCIQQLDNAFDAAFRKYHESFTNPE